MKAWRAAEKSFAIRAITSGAELDTQLALFSDAQKSKCLKEQIVRLVHGCGLCSHKPRFCSSTKDPAIGKEGSVENVAYLRRTLEGIWAAIEDKQIELPDEADAVAVAVAVP